MVYHWVYLVYLMNTYSSSLFARIIMFVQEPIFWCGVWTINDKGPLIFTQICH